MVLHLSSEHTPASARLTLRGELDISEAPRVERELRALESAGSPELVLDLRELSFMDSTGLRLIVGAYQRLSRAGRRMLVVRGPDAVQRIFSVTRLDERLEFVDAPPG